MIQKFDVWGETEDVLFLTKATRFQLFRDALALGLEPAREDERWFEQTYSYLWELRRLFWIELIPTGRIRVKLVHSGATGAGICPATLLRARKQEPLSDELSMWPESDSLVLQAEWFDRSDQIYMEGMNGGNLFGWPEIELVNIEYEDFDDEMFENSFSSQDVLQVSDSAKSPGWGSLSQDEQGQLVEILSELVFTQIDNFSEIVIDPRDVLAMIAAHPDTAEVVTNMRIYDGQKAINSLLA